MKCAFCELEDIQKRKIIESKLSWAFPTNIPITPGHTLITPKRCVEKVEELSTLELIDLFELTEEIKLALEKTFNSEGFNFAWNEGKCAGQSVPHVHIHIVPRKTGDEGVYGYEPREFLYRPGSRESTKEGELRDVAKTIRKNLMRI